MSHLATIGMRASVFGHFAEKLWGILVPMDSNPEAAPSSCQHDNGRRKLIIFILASYVCIWNHTFESSLVSSYLFVVVGNDAFWSWSKCSICVSSLTCSCNRMQCCVPAFKYFMTKQLEMSGGFYTLGAICQKWSLIRLWNMAIFVST